MSETLYDMASTLLELAANTFMADGNTAPSRQLVYLPPIPADCEQLVVTFSGWEPFPPPDGPVRCMNIRWMAGFSVIVTRCTPAVPKQAGNGKVQLPSAESMSTAAEMASRDAESLLNLVAAIGEVANVSIVTGAPVGGMQTVELDLSIPVGGI